MKGINASSRKIADVMCAISAASSLKSQAQVQAQGLVQAVAVFQLGTSAAGGNLTLAYSS
jgi:hypothetical protein